MIVWLPGDLLVLYFLLLLRLLVLIVTANFLRCIVWLLLSCRRVPISIILENCGLIENGLLVLSRVEISTWELRNDRALHG